MIKLKIVLIIFLLALVHVISADPNNITISYPIWDSQNDPVTSDFIVGVMVTDITASSVQAKISGGVWTSLGQITNQMYEGKLNISSCTDGMNTITARYQASGSQSYYYVLVPMQVKIIKPLPPVPTYGSVTFTVRNTNNAPIQGVLVRPSENVTDASGIVSVGHQNLNTPITFSFTKNDYNSSIQYITFTNSVLLRQSVTMGKVGGDLRDFIVSGYDGLGLERSSVVTIKDTVSGERIDGANVIIYNGLNVQNGPFISTNGRALVSISGTDAGYYMIEVSKSGYNTWDDDFRVWAVVVPPTPIPTPTPVVTPNPVIIPNERYYADADMKLTAEEYRAWMGVQENKTREANTKASQIIPNTPITNSSDSGISLISIFVYLVFLIILSYSSYIGYNRYWKNRNKPVDIDDTTDDKDVISSLEQPNTCMTTVRITCPKCNTWFVDMPSDLPKTIMNQTLESHIQLAHEKVYTTPKLNPEIDKRVILPPINSAGMMGILGGSDALMPVNQLREESLVDKISRDLTPNVIVRKPKQEEPEVEEDEEDEVPVKKKKFKQIVEEIEEDEEEEVIRPKKKKFKKQIEEDEEDEEDEEEEEEEIVKVKSKKKKFKTKFKKTR